MLLCASESDQIVSITLHYSNHFGKGFVNRPKDRPTTQTVGQFSASAWQVTDCDYVKHI
jgi:hypothetical protein